MTHARLVPGLSEVNFIEDDAEFAEAFARTQRGDFEVVTEPGGQRRFWFCCPGPCKSIAPLTIRPVVNNDPQSWELSGTPEAPTLRPSINHVGCWHGWLTDGVFTPC